MNLFNATLNNKTRAIIWIIASAAVAVTQSFTDLKNASFVLSVPVVVSILSHFTSIGNTPPSETK